MTIVTDNLNSIIDVTVENVRDKLRNLKTNKSAGPDGIHSRILKRVI